jgi:hypothetical protein
VALFIDEESGAWTRPPGQEGPPLCRCSSRHPVVRPLPPKLGRCPLPRFQLVPGSSRGGAPGASREIPRGDATPRPRSAPRSGTCCQHTPYQSRGTTSYLESPGSLRAGLLVRRSGDWSCLTAQAALGASHAPRADLGRTGGRQRPDLSAATSMTSKRVSEQRCPGAPGPDAASLATCRHESAASPRGRRLRRPTQTQPLTRVLWPSAG